jgi:hypothetical protein
MFFVYAIREKRGEERGRRERERGIHSKTYYN